MDRTASKELVEALEDQIDKAVATLNAEESYGYRKTYALGHARGAFEGLATLHRLISGRGHAYVRSDSEVRLGLRDPETRERINA